MRRRNPLLDLPVELLLSICDFLPQKGYGTTWLSLTCNRLYLTLNSRIVVSRARSFLILEYLVNDSIGLADARAPSQGTYACFRCYRFKPRSAFAVKQTTESHGQGALHAKATKRFSLQCGIEGEIYGGRSNEIRLINGELLLPCARCDRYRTGGFCLACVRCVQCLGIWKEMGDGICTLCGRELVKDAVYMGNV